ncbi:MAG: DNA polymerase III subunit beta [Candidatus Paceibacterota bacterium]|jgi:DNA polymerase-3 subunit beta
MITTILKDKLKYGISVVERISNKSLTLPILNNILLKTEKNFLNLSATDLEMGIQWWALVKTEKEGKITVPAKLLSSFVSFLPNKPITLKVKGVDLQIECENRETTIKGIDAEEFPIIPKVSEEEKLNINAGLFCRNLAKVVDIASFSSTKVEISGVYFSFQKDMVTMTATDSFRLGEKKMYLKASSTLSKNYSLILPQRTAKEIINVFAEKEGEMTIYFSPNQVMFETLLSETKHPDIQIISRLIEGEYPNYQEIIPKSYETKVTFKAEELVGQIKLASLFSGKVNEVKVKADPKKGELLVFSQDPDTGEHKGSIKVKIEGKACEVSFNHRFLLEGILSVMAGDEKNPEITLDLNGSDKAAVLRSKRDGDYLYLIMPIKTN